MVLPLVIGVALLLLDIVILVIGVDTLPTVLLAVGVSMLLLDVVLGMVLMMVVLPCMTTNLLVTMLLVVVDNGLMENGLTVDSEDDVEDEYCGWKLRMDKG